MPRKTQPFKPPLSPRRRIESNGQSRVLIEDTPGFSISLADATEVEEFSGSDTQWQAERERTMTPPTAKEASNPIDTI